MSALTTLPSQMQPIGRGVRAYFAPVDRANGTPTIFDPATISQFDLDTPSAPWIDLGWVENFQRTANTAVHPLRTGGSGAVAVQYRSLLDASVACEFLNWGKLQMAVAGGGVHYNVLATDGAASAPSGGRALLAATLLGASTATQLLLSPNDLGAFAAGDIVAVDVDYRGETGYVGKGVSGAYVTSDGVMRDMDYTRRVTFNVGRVKEKTSSALLLTEPLPGGTPGVNAGVQKVVGFVDREGGGFFQEWSAVFVIPEDSGGRICFYYPRLQAVAGGSEGTKSIATPIVGRTLKATFRALPITDLIDGEQAVCFRSYFPAASAKV